MTDIEEKIEQEIRGRNKATGEMEVERR